MNYLVLIATVSKLLKLLCIDTGTEKTVLTHDPDPHTANQLHTRTTVTYQQH